MITVAKLDASDSDSSSCEGDETPALKKTFDESVIKAKMARPLARIKFETLPLGNYNPKLDPKHHTLTIEHIDMSTLGTTPNIILDNNADFTSYFNQVLTARELPKDNLQLESPELMTKTARHESSSPLFTNLPLEPPSKHRRELVSHRTNRPFEHRTVHGNQLRKLEKAMKQLCAEICDDAPGTTKMAKAERERASKLRRSQIFPIEIKRTKPHAPLN